MDIELIKVVTSILIPFVVLFLGTIIGVIRYFLKKFADDIKGEFSRLEQKIEENDEKVSQVERDFMAFKAELPREFVMRRDFLRITTILEGKVDDLSGAMHAVQMSVSAQRAELKVFLKKIGELDVDRTEEDPAG